MKIAETVKKRGSLDLKRYWIVFTTGYRSEFSGYGNTIFVAKAPSEDAAKKAVDQHCFEKGYHGLSAVSSTSAEDRAKNEYKLPVRVFLSRFYHVDIDDFERDDVKMVG